MSATSSHNKYSAFDLSQRVSEEQKASVAVVGGDVASVVIAYMLSVRGHDVVWYRGQDCNPHPVSGVLKTYAADPVALPGFMLSVPCLLMRNAVRGKLSGRLNWGFVGWVFRSIAESRPLIAEAIARDRASLLETVVPAFKALSKVKSIDFASTSVSTLYPDARAFSYGWAAHDVCRRYGAKIEDLSFEDITQEYPHLSPQYTHGVRIPEVPVVKNAESLIETFKLALEQNAEIVRHWPQRINQKGKDQIEIQDGDVIREFDWVIRGDYSGPENLWPEYVGAVPLSLTYRERHLLRDLPDAKEANYQSDHVLVDGPSSAWLEHQGTKVIAAGAHAYGGEATEDLKYLTTASFAKIWRTLAGKGWHSEGGRVTMSAGCMPPDSRPLLGQAAPRMLEAAGFGELTWTLAATAGFAMIGFVEDRPDLQTIYQPFSPQRF